MANFTENEIKKSFLGLLNRKKLEAISVKDIVDDCRINRSSFYYHFTDIPTLLRIIMTESTETIISRYPEELTASECVEQLLRLILDNKRAALHIYRSASRELLTSQLTKGIRYGISHYVEYSTKGMGISEEEKHLLREYCVFFLLGFAIDWLESGLQEQKAEDFMIILRESGVDEPPFKEPFFDKDSEEQPHPDKIEKLSDFRTRKSI